MNRSERRRIDREIQKLIKADGEHCSICRAPLLHNGKTYYGWNAYNGAALTGDCCAERLDYTFGMGVFLEQGYDVLDTLPKAGRDKAKPPADIRQAIGGIQSYVDGIDAVSNDIRRKGGVLSGRSSVNVLDTPWKSDDAAWFAAHPNRSHRLRPLFPGEAATLPSDFNSKALPPRHEMQVVVRQVEPGHRIRTAFGRNLDVPIPDEEAVIHAIFDSIFAPREGEAVISVKEVVSLAKQYAAPPKDS